MALALTVGHVLTMAESNHGAAPSSVSHASGPGVVVGIGDSTCTGLGASEAGFTERIWQRVSQRHPGTRWLNLCRSGAQLSDVLRQQMPRWNGTGGIVLVSAGANDVTSGTPDATFRREFSELLDKALAHRPRAVIVSNIPDASMAPVIPPAFRPALAATIQRFNAQIAEVSREKNVLVFDTFAMSRAVLPRHPEFFSPDGYHPSDAGYRLWAEQLWPLVAGLL